MEYDIRKTCTKKQLKELYKSRRSIVGLGKNLGTRSMNSPKDYRRCAEKRKLYREISR